MDIQPGIYRPEFPMDGNFTLVSNQLIRATDISPTAKLLLIYLISHKVGYQILDDQIMRETGLGRHSLRSSRKELESLGFIDLVRVRHEDHSLGGYRYEIQDPRGYFSTVERSTVEDSTVENPPHNRKLISKKTNLEKTTLEISTANHFQQFWAVYPKKVDKPVAERAFTKALKRADLETILAGAERYRNDPNRQEAFTKNPATWLNADAWENAPEPVRDRKLTNAEKAALLALKYRSEQRELEVSYE